MPRIKPARTLEEIKAVPQDKSVTIALEPEGTVILDPEQDEADQAALEAKKAEAKPKAKKADKAQKADKAKAADKPKTKAKAKSKAEAAPKKKSKKA